MVEANTKGAAAAVTEDEGELEATGPFLYGERLTEEMMNL